LSDSNWFIIQTNYDRDEPDPFHDPRRIGVENRLRKYGNRVTEKSLFDDFMTLWPTFNIGTIMTAIMVPGTGFHNTTAWYQSNPSAPQTLSSLGLDIDYNKLTSMIEDLKLVQ
jgi:acid ceramidase/N-acylethanolamine-hydrolysing acid amidase